MKYFSCLGVFELFQMLHICFKLQENKPQASRHLFSRLDAVQHFH